MADPARTVIVSYADQVAAVRRRVVDFIRRAWGSLDSWRDTDIDRFVQQVTPIVLGGQMQTAAMTDAYLAAVQTATFGSTFRPVGVPPDAATNLRGVPTADVYARTGPTVWRRLAEGAPLALAVAAGLNRAVSMAQTDLQLARTHTSRFVLSSNSGVSGFRRVIDPDACSLCEGADHLYGVDELLPIHAGCACGSVPVFHGRPDPGTIHLGEPADDNRGDPVIREHGEIGPVLVSKDDDFTGPDDLDL